MYYLLTQFLFWIYWLIALVAGALIVREMLRTSSLTMQITAGLALVPLALRIFLLK